MNLNHWQQVVQFFLLKIFIHSISFATTWLCFDISLRFTKICQYFFRPKILFLDPENWFPPKMITFLNRHFFFQKGNKMLEFQHYWIKQFSRTTKINSRQFFFFSMGIRQNFFPTKIYCFFLKILSCDFHCHFVKVCAFLINYLKNRNNSYQLLRPLFNCYLSTLNARIITFDCVKILTPLRAGS